MVLTISKKLILAFLGLTLVVLISTLGLARWSFEQGFLDYVNALEETRLQLLADSLAEEYLGAGNSWSTLTEQRFEALLWEHSPGSRDEEARTGRPPPPGFMLPPPEFPPLGPSRPGPPGGGPPILGPPTVLYSVDGQLLADVPFPSEVIKPIRVSVLVNGEPVGELRSAPRRHFSLPQETAFSR